MKYTYIIVQVKGVLRKRFVVWIKHVINKNFHDVTMIVKWVQWWNKSSLKDGCNCIKLERGIDWCFFMFT
jgi:hypothetical protein